MLACPPTALRDVMISPSKKSVMGNGSWTNKISRATAYLEVGTAENSCMSTLKKKNNACKMFLIPSHHWVYGSPVFTGVLYFIPLKAEHPCGGTSFWYPPHCSRTDALDWHPPRNWVELRLMLTKLWVEFTLIDNHLPCGILRSSIICGNGMLSNTTYRKGSKSFFPRMGLALGRIPLFTDMGSIPICGLSCLDPVGTRVFVLNLKCRTFAEGSVY